MDPSVLRKLRWKSPGRTLVVAPPEAFAAVAATMGDVDTRARGRYPFALVFVRSARDVARSAARVAARLEADAVFWAAYPKKTSTRYQTDITRDRGWEPLGALGFEPVSQVALDDDWSALRFRQAARIPVLTRARALSGEGRARTDRSAAPPGEGRDRTDRGRAAAGAPGEGRGPTDRGVRRASPSGEGRDRTDRGVAARPAPGARPGRQKAAATRPRATKKR